jgi:hypothetical protein
MQRWEVGETAWPHATTATSLDAFMHHPLAVLVPKGCDEPSPVAWTCRTPIHDAAEFAFMVRPGAELGLIYWESVVRWLTRKGIKTSSSHYAILDIKNKEIFHVDAVAERKGKLCLVLLYHVDSPHPAFKTLMLKHARQVKATCKEQYALEPEIALLRLSPNGNCVHGQFI